MELYDRMQSYYRCEERRVKREIMHDFIMAEVKTRYLYRKENDAVPHPWEYYPELFAEEKKNYETRKKEEEIEAYREAKRAYVEEFNRRRQQGK